jgi:transposase
MTADTILAIDLGKYKCVACTYDRATAVAEFRTLTTSRAELERLIRVTGPAVVVIEACSLSGWVHDLCGELGVPCKVANTAAEAWKYKHTKRKTDRDDAPASRNCTPSVSSRRWSSRPGGCASGGH